MKPQIAILKLSNTPHKRRIMQLLFQIDNIDFHLTAHPGCEYDVEIIDRPVNQRHSTKRIVLNLFQEEPDANEETNTLTINPSTLIKALELMAQQDNTNREVQA